MPASTEPSGDQPAVRLALTTAPTEAVAEEIGLALVEEGLVACVNVVPGLTSIYRWRGAVEREREVLLILKTTAPSVEPLRARLVELHPYEVPELVALDVADGHGPYLDWVRSEVAQGG